MYILFQCCEIVRILLDLSDGSVRQAKQNGANKSDSYILVDMTGSPTPIGQGSRIYTPKTDSGGNIIDDMDEVMRSMWRVNFELQFYNYNNIDTIRLYMKLENQFKSNFGKEQMRIAKLGYGGISKGGDFGDQVNGVWINRTICYLSLLVTYENINSIKEFKTFQVKKH